MRSAYLKEHKSWIYTGIIIAGLLALLIITFLLKKPQDPPPSTARDYDAIAQEGIIRATTEYNSVSFFLEGDTVTGFNYELLQAFARDHGLKVEIHPEMAFNTCLEGLNDGTFDVIANGILATSELKDSLLLTNPIALSRQILIQRKPSSDNDSSYIKSLLDLGKKTIYIPKDYPYMLRLRNLESEIGDTIYIQEMEKYGSEQLISLVAHGDIDYAVCEEGIATVAADSLPQIDISTAIGFTQFYSWAVNKQSPALLDTLNVWIDNFKKGKEYERIYRRYYLHRRL